jgi:glyoxylase-like metal-dependent hydrolase (beta-lactamase superfamily II)
VAQPQPEEISKGIWRVAGDIKGGMNVYFLADDDGVTMFDAGTKPMTDAVKAAGEKLGGIKRIVLGHAHTDHRGSAPGIDAPVYCHADEVADAEREGWQIDYWDIGKVEVAPVRWIYPTLHRRWDAGACDVAGTVKEGDTIAGFEVLDFPGHAPGLIGLWREADRMAIVSDTVYFVDPARLKARDPIEDANLDGHDPTVPHPAYNKDTAQARASLRKLAALKPKTVWAGHESRLTGDPEAMEQALLRGAEVKFPEHTQDHSA